jgi:hypothetical protein
MGEPSKVLRLVNTYAPRQLTAPYTVEVMILQQRNSIFLSDGELLRSLPSGHIGVNIY